jgi:hypothetical protein
MDKDKVINEILMEWAMRSPDGLAGGWDTPENRDALEEALYEQGLNNESVDMLMESVFGEATGRRGRESNAEKLARAPDFAYLFRKRDDKTKPWYLVTYTHPDQKKFPDGQVYKGKTNLDVGEYRVANKKNISDARTERESDPAFKDMRQIKKVSIDNVQKLKRVCEAFPDESVVKLFKSLYNKVDLEKAIKIYEGNDYPALQPLINKIDDTRFAGVGRGEIPMVFMMKNAQSGGNSKMDILFAELGPKRGGIEVKEVIGGTIAISAPTLTGYSSSRFNVAVHEFVLAANKIKGMRDFLIKVLTDKGVSKGGIYPAIANERYEKKHKDAILKFFADPKVGEISYYFLDAIFIISEKIMRKNAMTGKGQAVPPPVATIDVDIGSKHREFKVPDVEVGTLDKQIDNIAKGTAPAKLNVSLEYTEESGDEFISQNAMKLSFFRENWDQERVQGEIIELILKKYGRMLIVDKSEGNKILLFKRGDISKLEFYGVGFGKIFMAVPGFGAKRDDDLKNTQDS